jgi:hypothetical protein
MSAGCGEGVFCIPYSWMYSKWYCVTMCYVYICPRPGVEHEVSRYGIDADARQREPDPQQRLGDVIMSSSSKDAWYDRDSKTFKQTVRASQVRFLRVLLPYDITKAWPKRRIYQAQGLRHQDPER